MLNSITIQNRKPVFASNGRVVGWVENNTLYKKVKSSRHMLQKPRGWAWDESIINEAIHNEVTKLEIRDTETGKVYRSTLNTFIRQGIRLDRGYSPQICLPLKFWEIIDPYEILPRQLDLFGAAYE